MAGKITTVKISLLRRLSQAGGLLLAVAGVVVPGMTHIIYPGLHCYACPLAVTICPIGLVQNLLKNSLPLFPVAMLGIYSILLGRWWCGWVCPFGLFNDLFIPLASGKPVKLILALAAFFICGLAAVLVLLSASYKWLALLPLLGAITALLCLVLPLVKKGIQGMKRKRLLTVCAFCLFVLLFPLVLLMSTERAGVIIPGLILTALLLGLSLFIYLKQRGAYFLKFTILLLTIGLAVTGADTLFCKLCPSAAVSAALPYLALQPVFTPGVMYLLKLAVLLLTIALLLLVARFFCRYLCPLGAVFGLANKISLLKIKRSQLCTTDKKNCGFACSRSCPMGIKDIMQRAVLTQTDCIKCGRCIEACPNGYLGFGYRINKQYKV